MTSIPPESNSIELPTIPTIPELTNLPEVPSKPDPDILRQSLQQKTEGFAAKINSNSVNAAEVAGEYQQIIGSSVAEYTDVRVLPIEVLNTIQDLKLASMQATLVALIGVVEKLSNALGIVSDIANNAANAAAAAQATADDAATKATTPPTEPPPLPPTLPGTGEPTNTGTTTGTGVGAVGPGPLPLPPDDVSGLIQVTEPMPTEPGQPFEFRGQWFWNQTFNSWQPAPGFRL